MKYNPLDPLGNSFDEWRPKKLNYLDDGNGDGPDDSGGPGPDSSDPFSGTFFGDTPSIDFVNGFDDPSFFGVSPDLTSPLGVDPTFDPSTSPLGIDPTFDPSTNPTFDPNSPDFSPDFIPIDVNSNPGFNFNFNPGVSNNPLGIDPTFDPSTGLTFDPNFTLGPQGPDAIPGFPGSSYFFNQSNPQAFPDVLSPQDYINQNFPSPQEHMPTFDIPVPTLPGLISPTQFNPNDPFAAPPVLQDNTNFARENALQQNLMQTQDPQFPDFAGMGPWGALNPATQPAPNPEVSNPLLGPGAQPAPQDIADRGAPSLWDLPMDPNQFTPPSQQQQQQEQNQFQGQLTGKGVDFTGGPFQSAFPTGIYGTPPSQMNPSVDPNASFGPNPLADVLGDRGTPTVLSAPGRSEDPSGRGYDRDFQDFGPGYTPALSGGMTTGPPTVSSVGRDSDLAGRAVDPTAYDFMTGGPQAGRSVMEGNWASNLTPAFPTTPTATPGVPTLTESRGGVTPQDIQDAYNAQAGNRGQSVVEQNPSFPTLTESRGGVTPQDIRDAYNAQNPALPTLTESRGGVTPQDILDAYNAQSRSNDPLVETAPQIFGPPGSREQLTEQDNARAPQEFNPVDVRSVYTPDLQLNMPGGRAIDDTVFYGGRVGSGVAPFGELSGTITGRTIDPNQNVIPTAPPSVDPSGRGLDRDFQNFGPNFNPNAPVPGLPGSNNPAVDFQNFGPSYNAPTSLLSPANPGAPINGGTVTALSDRGASNDLIGLLVQSGVTQGQIAAMLADGTLDMLIQMANNP